MVVEKDAAFAREIAEEEAGLSVDERGVQRLYAVGVETDFTAHRAAQQRHRPDKRATDAGEPAIDDDQLGRRAGALTGASMRGVLRASTIGTSDCIDRRDGES